MKGLSAAVWAESLKARRSKMFPATILVTFFFAVLMGLLMYVGQHPEIAGRSAAISAKLPLIGHPDWHSYFTLLIQSVLAMGALEFGMVASWVFGREYADRVIKDLFALPVSRGTIVTAKFFICMLWCIILALVLFVDGLVTGLVIGIPGWSADGISHEFSVFAGSAMLTLLLCTPVAFLASASRGYLLAIAFTVASLIVTNFVAVGVPNMMPYFPWGIPALFSGIAGREALPHAGTVSYLILASTSVAGFLGTAAWWRFADQT